MNDITITLGILVVAIVLFIWNRLPVATVALLVALSLWASGVLTMQEIFEGFGSPTLILIAALFVVAEGLDAAGLTTWAGQLLVQHAGGSRVRLIVFTMLISAVLSALITPNGAVAALFPMCVVLAVRLGMSPAQLLLPLAFSAHAGSMLVLTGSPVNVLVLEAALSTGNYSLGFFEFARVGIPLLIGTILVVVFFGERLLPNRTARAFTRDLSRLPQDLLSQYIANESLVRLSVSPASRFSGLLANRANAGDAFPTLHIVGVLNEHGIPLQNEAITSGTVLVVRGPQSDIARFAGDNHLTIGADLDASPATLGLLSHDFGVAEVIVAPRSNYIGETVFPGQVTDSGKLVILGVQRHDTDLGMQNITLQAGDAMLLQGRWEALDQHTRDPNVVLVDSPDAIRRQAAPLGPRVIPAILVMAGMVLLLTFNLVPAAIACLVAAIAMVLTGVVTSEQAQRSLNWTTLILVAAMIPLSTAITNTGAAELLAGGIINAVGGYGPYVLLLGLFLITAILGQLISNTATALILIPIGLSVAADMNLSPLAVLMCINVASAAALLTPIATPGNLMVMEPGGYRFGDYWKLGLPVMLVYLVVAVFLVPLWWPF
ncbi:MAG: SLC13 family permease [Chloroflexota bacterium]|nr:SLC13 family permease [Chloroflexota bacterium]